MTFESGRRVCKLNSALIPAPIMVPSSSITDRTLKIWMNAETVSIAAACSGFTWETSLRLVTVTMSEMPLASNINAKSEGRKDESMPVTSKWVRLGIIIPPFISLPMYGSSGEEMYSRLRDLCVRGLVRGL